MKWLSRLSRTHKPGNRVMETDRLWEYAESLAGQQEFDYFSVVTTIRAALRSCRERGRTMSTSVHGLRGGRLTGYLNMEFSNEGVITLNRMTMSNSNKVLKLGLPKGSLQDSTIELFGMQGFIFLSRVGHISPRLMMMSWKPYS